MFSSTFNSRYLTNKIDPSNNKKKKKCQTANGPQEVSVFCRHFVKDRSKKQNLEVVCFPVCLILSVLLSIPVAHTTIYTYYLSQTIQSS
jgi:hypothetical protein